MRQGYLKRFGINACPDDARAKMEHLKVVCEGELFKVLVLNKKYAICFGSQKHFN